MPRRAPDRTGSTESIERMLDLLVPQDSPVRVESVAGSHGSPDAPTVLRITSPDAIGHMLRAPGELGFARAYVAGHLDIEGDITRLLDARFDTRALLRHPSVVVGALREVGLRRMLTDDDQAYPEATVSGRRHSVRRDRTAVDYHYEAPTPFFELLLGPSMAYTCAVFPDDRCDLTTAQRNKYDLVGRKLALTATSRVLDIGCGWGGFALHAAETTGCEVVGVTLGTRQAAYGRAQTQARGLADRVEIRLQDYRDVTDGPYDAVVAIGAFEHIGLPKRGPTLFDHVTALLKPGGRFLNQAISSQTDGIMAARRGGFIQRFVFPDGELHELGRTISAMQAAGLEVRHAENLREHYVLTADRWRGNLEDDWPTAVATGGEARARIWRLFLAAYRWQLVQGRIGVCQTLAVKADDGRSGVALGEDFSRGDGRSAPIRG